MSTGRFAEFKINVCPNNRNWEYGRAVTVMAATRAEAITRAIDLGWGGRRGDVKVSVLSVKDLDPRECPCTAKEATKHE